VKTTGPAIAADELGDIDVVLLSHDHHSDNLDPAGREFLPRAQRVLTTVDGAARLGGNAAAVAPWEAIAIEGLDTIYVSGDNASLDVVRQIKARVGAVDVAVLFAGAGARARGAANRVAGRPPGRERRPLHRSRYAARTPAVRPRIPGSRR